MNVADPFLVPEAAWRIGSHALLVLDATRDGGRTVLHPRQRRTPYQWQLCHYQDRDDQPFVQLHSSSGGFVEGDRATLHIDAAPDTRFLLTTTGANRYFKCEHGGDVRDEVTLNLGERCLAEYLPDEAIPYARSRVRRRFAVNAAPSARLFLSDILVAGRLHFRDGESFAFDALRSETRVVIGGRTAWMDRLVLDGRDQVRDLEALWGGHAVMGTVVWYAPDLPESLLDDVADACERTGEVAASVTRPGPVGCMRIFGAETWQVHAAVLEVWARVRPALAGKPARAIRKP